MKTPDAMPRNPAAYAYIRFSTDDQRKGHSLERQIANVRAFAEARGLPPLDVQSFRDEGVSAFRGTNDTKGALGKFLDRVKAGDIGEGDWLVLENLDRLSRRSLEEAFPLLTSITNAGVTVATVNDGAIYKRGGFDFATFMRAGLAQELAHQESKKKSERLCAVWAAKRAKLAERKLTARCPGWLKLSEDKKTFTVIPERAKVVRRVFRDTAAGLGRGSIANALNSEKVPVWRWGTGWTKTHVSEILLSRAVVGEFQPCKMEGRKRVPNGDPLKDYFPRVVSDAEFFAARAKVRDRCHAGRAVQSVNNLFSRICFCGQCGGPVHYVNKARGAVYLRCDHAARRLKACKPASQPYAPLEKAFVRWLVNFDFTEATKNERGQKLNELAAAKERQAEATRKVERLAEAMAKSTLLVDTFLPQIERAKVEADACAAEVAMLTATVASMQDRTPSFDVEAAAKNSANRERLREGIRQRVRRVVMFPDRFRVELPDGRAIDLNSDGSLGVELKRGRSTRLIMREVDRPSLVA